MLALSQNLWPVGAGSQEQWGRLSTKDKRISAEVFPAAEAWRDHYNDGDFIYCGEAFVDDASVQIHFGPTAEEVQQLLKLPSPAVLRGTGALVAFWNASQTVLGLKKMTAFEESGDYASTALVLDDDTVLIEGPISFTGARKQLVEGSVLSQMWVRDGKNWAIRSLVFTIEAVTPSVPLAPPRSRERSHKDVTEAPKGEDEEQEDAEAEKTKAASTAAEGKGKRTHTHIRRVPQDKDKEANEVAAKEEELLEEPKKSSGPSTLMLTLVVLMTCGVAAFLVRRTKKRQQATIAGFEAMLG